MRAETESALELMALADDEIEGEAKVRVERRLETDGQARELVAEMRDARVASWLKDAMAEQALRAGADGIADSVLDQVMGSAVRGRVGRVERGRIRFRGLALGAAFAVAAGIALLLWARAPLPASAPVAVRVGPIVSTPASSASDVELDEIDSPSHDVSVYEISGSTELAANSPRTSSVVIWIDDQPGVQ